MVVMTSLLTGPPRGTALGLCLSGATGRMGRLLAEAIADQPDMAVAGALVRPGHPAIGQDLGRHCGRPPLGVDCTDLPSQAVNRADGIIDFSRPEALPTLVAAAPVRGCFLLVGTTGLSAADHILLEQAAAEIPVLDAANTSLAPVSSPAKPAPAKTARAKKAVPAPVGAAPAAKRPVAKKAARKTS